MAELHHECGICGLYLLPGDEPVRLPAGVVHDDVAPLIPRMLLDLQNRGQLAAGMTGYDPKRDNLLATYRDLGPVDQAFRTANPEKNAKILKSVAGRAAIGHVRYATCGPDNRQYAQPFERPHGVKWKWFAFSFNGQLANYPLLRDELESHGFHLVRATDTEVIMHHLSYELRGGDRVPIEEVFRSLAGRFDGAYNLLYLDAAGEMVALRDPLGIRPLCWGRIGRLVGFASESAALLNLGFRDIESVPPGEMIVVTPAGIRRARIAPPADTAHCFFEWIYFANAASELDDRSVYQVRRNLGIELARTEAIRFDPSDSIVVPVPDTSKAAADAMAFALGLPSMEGLLRNRYVGRTFIEAANREEKVRRKFTPVRQVLEGKRVVLVEDSIVRSTTLMGLVTLLKSVGGAKEIHVRVACPPIVAPCFYGIDMSRLKELFARRYMSPPWTLTDEVQAKMAGELGADSLRYLPVDSLARAMDLPPERLCRACVTGDYPTPEGRRLYQLQLAHPDNGTRAYEAAQAR